LLVDLAQRHVERFVTFHKSDASLRLIDPATSLRPDRPYERGVTSPGGDHRTAAV